MDNQPFPGYVNNSGTSFLKELGEESENRNMYSGNQSQPQQYSPANPSPNYHNIPGSHNMYRMQSPHWPAPGGQSQQMTSYYERMQYMNSQMAQQYPGTKAPVQDGNYMLQSQSTPQGWPVQYDQSALSYSANQLPSQEQMWGRHPQALPGSYTPMSSYLAQTQATGRYPTPQQSSGMPSPNVVVGSGTKPTPVGSGYPTQPRMSDAMLGMGMQPSHQGSYMTGQNYMNHPSFMASAGTSGQQGPIPSQQAAQHQNSRAPYLNTPSQEGQFPHQLGKVPPHMTNQPTGYPPGQDMMSSQQASLYPGFDVGSKIRHLEEQLHLLYQTRGQSPGVQKEMLEIQEQIRTLKANKETELLLKQRHRLGDPSAGQSASPLGHNAVAYPTSTTSQHLKSPLQHLSQMGVPHVSPQTDYQNATSISPTHVLLPSGASIQQSNMSASPSLSHVASLGNSPQVVSPVLGPQSLTHSPVISVVTESISAESISIPQTTSTDSTNTKGEYMFPATEHAPPSLIREGSMNFRSGPETIDDLAPPQLTAAMEDDSASSSNRLDELTTPPLLEPREDGSFTESIPNRSSESNKSPRKSLENTSRGDKKETMPTLNASEEKPGDISDSASVKSNEAAAPVACVDSLKSNSLDGYKDSLSPVKSQNQSLHLSNSSDVQMVSPSKTPLSSVSTPLSGDQVSPTRTNVPSSSSSGNLMVNASDMHSTISTASISSATISVSTAPHSTISPMPPPSSPSTAALSPSKYPPGNQLNVPPRMTSPAAVSPNQSNYLQPPAASYGPVPQYGMHSPNMMPHQRPMYHHQMQPGPPHPMGQGQYPGQMYPGSNPPPHHPMFGASYVSVVPSMGPGQPGHMAPPQQSQTLHYPPQQNAMMMPGQVPSHMRQYQAIAPSRHQGFAGPNGSPGGVPRMPGFAPILPKDQSRSGMMPGDGDAGLVPYPPHSTPTPASRASTPSGTGKSLPGEPMDDSAAATEEKPKKKKRQYNRKRKNAEISGVENAAAPAEGGDQTGTGETADAAEGKPPAKKKYTRRRAPAKKRGKGAAETSGDGAEETKVEDAAEPGEMAEKVEGDEEKGDVSITDQEQATPKKKTKVVKPKPKPKKKRPLPTLIKKRKSRRYGDSDSENEVRFESCLRTKGSEADSSTATEAASHLKKRRSERVTNRKKYDIDVDLDQIFSGDEDAEQSNLVTMQESRDNDNEPPIKVVEKILNWRKTKRIVQHVSERPKVEVAEEKAPAVEDKKEAESCDLEGKKKDECEEEKKIEGVEEKKEQCEEKKAEQNVEEMEIDKNEEEIEAKTDADESEAKPDVEDTEARTNVDDTEAKTNKEEALAGTNEEPEASKTVEEIKITEENTKKKVEEEEVEKKVEKKKEIEMEEVIEEEEEDVEEFYVKYKGYSYLHCEWRALDEIEDPRIASKLKRQKAKWSRTEPSEEDEEEDLFNPDYVEVDRVLDMKVYANEAAAIAAEVAETGVATQEEDEDRSSSPQEVTYYLVKWRSLAYEEATWELAQDVDPNKVKDYIRWREPPPEDTYHKTRPSADEWIKIEVEREYKNDNKLRDYQLEGVNWLSFCWFNQRNCILADEMGLGKTVQSITFLIEVFDYGVRGPYLVVVPLSTLGNWQREFEHWSNMNVIVYHGSSTSRQMLQEYEIFYRSSDGEKVQGVYKFHALITTYEVLMTDIEFFGQIDWRVAVIDEAHRLKNKKCKLNEGLRYLELEHRVLLTGTPLQNNVEELFSLLNFLEPEKFPNPQTFLSEFGDLKTEEQVDNLKSLLKPMMLRRLKEDVEKSIAPKEETIIEVELTNIQKKYYRAIMERNFAFLSKGASYGNVPNLMNTMMELRKCCNHPFLIKGAEEKILAEMREQAEAEAHEDLLQFQSMVQSSGKLVLVHKLLPKLKADGHKVLVFSQMIKVLDILEDFLLHQGYQYERIDGRIHGLLRQEAIDRFTADKDKFIFLLCTKAGGLGINLTAADTVIIYDSDWNPQNDLQAQARCHRIGQEKLVNVYRLITRNTYEREMFDRASLKLGLDKAVLQSMGSKEARQSQLSKKDIEDLLKKGAYGALMEDDNAGEEFCEADIDQILKSRAHVVQLEQGEKNSTFSKATFSMSDNRNDIELDDPNFWQKWAKKAGVDENLHGTRNLIMEEPRRRRQTHRYAAESARFEMSDMDDSSRSSDDDTSGGGRRKKKDRKAKKLGKPTDTEGGADEPLDRADLFRVEKCLLLWGWGRWEYALSLTPFKRRPTTEELEAISRAIVTYALRHYKGDERIRCFVWDLVKPDSVAADMRRHSGLAAPVVRGRRGRRLRDRGGGATPEEPPEPDTLLPNGVSDMEMTVVLACDSFRRHLERAANKLVHRVQILYLVEHEVIGPVRSAVLLSGGHYSTLSSPLPPRNSALELAESIPGLAATWWDEEADKCLLLGVHKHGWERYAAMRADPALCFAGKCGPGEGADLPDNEDEEEKMDTSFMEGSCPKKYLDDTSADATREDTRDMLSENHLGAGESNDVRPDSPVVKKSDVRVKSGDSDDDVKAAVNDIGGVAEVKDECNSVSTKEAVGEEPMDVDEKEDLDADKIKLKQEGRSSSPKLAKNGDKEGSSLAATKDLTSEVLDSKDDIDDESSGKALLPFPSNTDLNYRFRKLITYFQRRKHQEEFDTLRRKRLESTSDSPKTENAWPDMKQLKWSRREEADFYRVVSCFGVEVDKVNNDFKWDNFRGISTITRKTDYALSEYYKAFYFMCRSVCKRAGPEETSPSLVKVEPISEERAGRCLGKIDLLNRIRNEVLPHPRIQDRIKLCQRSSDFPDWWVPGKHDLDLLKGASKHGLTRTDYNILSDTSLSFHEVVSLIEARIRDDPLIARQMSTGGVGAVAAAAVSALAAVPPRDSPSRASVTSDRTEAEEGPTNGDLEISTNETSGVAGESVGPASATRGATAAKDDPKSSSPAAIPGGSQSAPVPAEQAEWSLRFATNIAVGWPKDRTIQHRLELVCQCVETGEWPTPRRFLVPCSTPSGSNSNLPTSGALESSGKTWPVESGVEMRVGHSPSPSASSRGRGRGRGRRQYHTAATSVGMSPLSGSAVPGGIMQGITESIIRRMQGHSEDTESVASTDTEARTTTPLREGSATPVTAETGPSRKRRIDSLAERLLTAAVADTKRDKLDHSPDRDTPLPNTSAVAQSSSKRPELTPPSSGSGQDTWDVRVPVINLRDGSLIYGEEAPRRRDLEKWLQDQAEYMPYSVEREDQEIYNRVAQARGGDTSAMEALAYSHYLSVLQSANPSYALMQSNPTAAASAYGAGADPTSLYSGLAAAALGYGGMAGFGGDAVAQNGKEIEPPPKKESNRTSTSGRSSSTRGRKPKSTALSRPEPSISSHPTPSELDPSSSLEAMMAAYQAYMYNPLIYNQLIAAQSGYSSYLAAAAAAAQSSCAGLGLNFNGDPSTSGGVVVEPTTTKEKVSSRSNKSRSVDKQSSSSNNASAEAIAATRDILVRDYGVFLPNPSSSGQRTTQSPIVPSPRPTSNHDDDVAEDLVLDLSKKS